MRDHVTVVIDLFQQAQRVKVGDNPLARLEPIEALVSRWHRVVQGAVGVEDVDHLEAVALADLKVVEVVRRGDLYRARTGLRVGIVIAGNGNETTDQRQVDGLADQRLIARVFGVHHHAGIAQHGFRAGGGNGDMAPILAVDGVAEVPEVTVDLLLFDLKVGNRGLELGVPVHQPLVLVDQALAVELDEGGFDRLAQPLIHGEALARPIRRCAEVAQLLGDGAARLLAPLPRTAQELVPAHVLLGQAFGIEFAVDDRLHGDTGVVGAGLMQHVALAHAVVADQHVLQRERQPVPHVQRTRDVRRRHHHRIGLAVRGGITGKGARLFPLIAVFGFGCGSVKGLIEHDFQL